MSGSRLLVAWPERQPGSRKVHHRRPRPAFPSHAVGFPGWGLLTGAQRSASANGDEADEHGGHQQNGAGDQPQSCRIHRHILGEDGRNPGVSDRGWTRSA